MRDLSVSAEPNELVNVQNLSVWFPLRREWHGFKRSIAWLRAVDGVSFSLVSGETLGLVGESGCGKSTLGRAIVGIQRPTQGRIFFKGHDIGELPHHVRAREIRHEMQMIFQDPYASLNPRLKVGKIIGEPFEILGLIGRKERAARVKDLLGLVGLEPSHAGLFPHEFSGGQRQRIAIARALALQPSLVVCDEPVSSLDVSIRGQVINLLIELQEQLNLAYVFIGHDMALMRHIVSRLAVMYLGKFVEVGDRDRLFLRPLHPYTKALLSAAPIPDPETERSRERMVPPGDSMSDVSVPSGCRFRMRCPFAQQVCRDVEPELVEVETKHLVACHFWQEIESGHTPGPSGRVLQP